MKLFVRNMILFFLPVFALILCVIPFYVILLISGEIAPLQHNIEKQRLNQNILLGLSYNEQTASYKLANANYYQPDIIALGTSRVMQFKGECFNRSFYNCGGAVKNNYSEYKNFLENLSYQPNILLLGLDSWMFNDEWNKNCIEYDEYKEIKEIDRKKAAMVNSALADWIAGKWNFSSIKNYTQNIGFNGKIKDAGFMCDGSYYYGHIYRDPQGQKDWGFANTLDKIAHGKDQFKYGDHIDNGALTQLESLLKYCKEQEICVIGLSPPYAPAIYETMISTDNYKYLQEIAPACEQLFHKYEYEFYDFADGKTLDVTDDYFIDGFHGSEVVYAHILLNMAENNSLIDESIDTMIIEELIQKRL